MGFSGTAVITAKLRDDGLPTLARQVHSSARACGSEAHLDTALADDIAEAMQAAAQSSPPALEPLASVERDCLTGLRLRPMGRGSFEEGTETAPKPTADVSSGGGGGQERAIQVVHHARSWRNRAPQLQVLPPRWP